jgi:hypothetical protein
VSFLVIPAAVLLVAAAAATYVQLMDGVVQVPAGDWRYVEVALKQQTAFVSADYQVESGSPDIRLALVRREDLERMRNQMPDGALAVTAAAPSGHIRYRVPERGVYVVLIDNRASSRPAAAHLLVSLNFGLRPGPTVTRLSPQRQITVIAISFAVFFAIATYSTRRLLRGIRRV